MTDLLVDDHLSGECLASKHGACNGDAWCMEDDRQIDCECPHHNDAEVVAA